MRLPAKLGTIGAGLVLGMIGLIQTGLAADPRKPNIVLLVADDMGYADVGFNGCSDVPTPNAKGKRQKAKGIRQKA